jgi:FtsP/CotA-like multicopper oxidase with cupredoxin domain
MKALSYEQIDEAQSGNEFVFDIEEKTTPINVTTASSKFVWSIPFILFSVLVFFLYYDMPTLSTEPKLSSSSGLALSTTFSAPVFLVADNGMLDVVLRVNVCRHNISNLVFYSTRCYNGNIPGPTLVASPGDRIRIRLINELSPEGYDEQPANIFRHPNITSLHLHGLHVSPTNENLYEPCYPGEELVYEFELPRTHDTGTFYYHPHYHGSSALQVLGGMAGALLIQDRNSTREYAAVDDANDNDSFGFGEAEDVDGANVRNVVAVLQR